MAGTSNPLRTGPPGGPDDGFIRMTMGPVSIDGDTSGYKMFASIKADYDFYVKKANVTAREGSFTDSDASIKMKILDDSGSAQTIVAEVVLDTSYDAGAPIAQTIADEGPILCGGVVDLQLDAGSGDVLKDVCVELWVKPRF